MRNADVHKAFKDAKVKKYVVAEMLWGGTTDVMFSKKLRKEFSLEQKGEIFAAIAKVKNENFNGGDDLWRK